MNVVLSNFEFRSIEEELLLYYFPMVNLLIKSKSKVLKLVFKQFAVNSIPIVLRSCLKFSTFFCKITPLWRVRHLTLTTIRVWRNFPVVDTKIYFVSH